MKKLLVLVLFLAVSLFPSAGTVRAETDQPGCAQFTLRPGPSYILVDDPFPWPVYDRFVPGPDGCNIDLTVNVPEEALPYIVIDSVFRVGGGPPLTDVCEFRHQSTWVRCAWFATGNPIQLGVVLRGRDQATVGVSVDDPENQILTYTNVTIWNRPTVLAPLVLTGHRISSTACEPNDC